jgi:ATPase subunit of ABC transporter with duplicated ATPase domains
MGYVDVVGLSQARPDGRPLLEGVAFRIGEGSKAALIGSNGVGKTTLLRIIAGDLPVQRGTVSRSGGLGVMRQFIGSVRDATTVQEFLVGLAPPAVKDAWDGLEAAELVLMERDDERSQLDYAHALTHWGDAGGYDVEILWDTVTVAALGLPFDDCKYRELMTLSGGEQKRLALELLLRGSDEVLLLDEPTDNLDVLSAEALEEALDAFEGTVLAVTHDRWFARSFDRFLVFGADGTVYESSEPVFGEARVARPG